MRKFCTLLLVIAAGLASGAMVATQTVHQQGRMFSVDHLTIKAGETLTFVNDDNITHNVASLSKGSEFDLGSQRPGSSTDVTLTEVGEVQVFCAIHPRMKLSVKVLP
jgi:plastocyanin